MAPALRSVVSLFLISILVQVTLALECNICRENGLARKLGFREDIIRRNQSRNVVKRYVDTTFRGHPKTKAEILSINFKMATYGGTGSPMSQSMSLVHLLNKIAVDHFRNCPPYILYDTYVQNSENYILQKLFQTFPLTFYHGRINEDMKLENPEILANHDSNCRVYILFLSNPQETRRIIGPQITNKVVVVARSSQWMINDFLSSEESSNIINLLVIGESLVSDPKKERPYVLYTQKLYADGLGSNVPVVLTSWFKGALTRPHINLFPPKFAHGFAGHRFLVAAVNQPPFIFRRKTIDATGTVNINWEGIEYRLMMLLAQRLNFSFEIVEPKNTVQLGSGEAVREEVQLRRADIGMAGAYITVERLNEIDMSAGHTRDCAAFITLASKALPK